MLESHLNFVLEPHLNPRKSCSEGVQDESMNDTFCDLEPNELLGRHAGSDFVLAPHLSPPEELL